ncbi:nitrate- and nitrite sensing domain-containing protein [Micromonospora sp. NPDC049559]|uniref:sensor histidine kinase n=1 Tax=Micromonospora sp. NPDC049559 TaxID=3155923 RepID=UPI00343C2D80
MSKRPNTANSFLSRLRRPMGRLRDMPIWSKLGLIMIVPTVATVVVGTSGLIDHLDTLGTANRASTLANLTQASGELVADLQDERAAAVLLLAPNTPAAAKQKYRETYSQLHPKVDGAKGPYSEQRSKLEGLPTNFSRLLDEIDQELADLPAVRSQVFNAKLRLTDAVQSYESLIGDLLDMRDSAAALAGDTSLSERIRAVAAVARAKEFLEMRRVVVHRALIQNTLSSALFTEYIGTEQGQQQALQSFKAVATRAESDFYDQTVSGSDQREADTYSGWVRSKQTDTTMQFAPFNADQWDAAVVSNAKLIRTVESRFDADVVAQADNIRGDVQRQVFLETGGLLITLLVAIFFAFLVARSMARSLRELRHGALSIAQYGLPQAVARLRDPQLTAQMSPVQVANQIAEPLPVRSNDEFGQVTEAFNAVHLEAVRTAAEQAALRSSVATMFVNLARRSQILVDRLIGHLDRLERGEEDPDRLAELFQLDHLATRMRRNDENLLVLAGADSTRVQREPAALIDVLRAAQSEVEHYTRIEFGTIDRDIEVAAHAVNDLVHLVAELFDNATAFSPPDSKVMVEARRVGDRASLFVEDRGIGISADQLRDLNERLATPPMVDVTVSRMMGLVVVARLASRHGVKVELRPGTDRGTTADVTLPTAVLVPRALAGRPLPGADQPAPRPPATSPLALESAPTIPPLPRQGDRDNQLVGPGGRRFDPMPLNGGSPGGNRSGGGRSMPAWSDLTGANAGPNGGDPFTPKPSNGRGGEPLPQRRSPADEETPEETPGGGIPRQIPTSPETWSDPSSTTVLPPVSGPPVSAPPRSVSGPPVPPRSVSAPPLGAPGNGVVPPVGGGLGAGNGAPPVIPPGNPTPPPAWPPVAPPERETTTPPVPEKLAAALDMTAELPKVMRNRPEPAAPQQPAANRQQFADETMELPIFRELESAWFRTRRPAAEEAGGGAPAPKQPTGQVATVDVDLPAPRSAAPAPGAGGTAGQGTPPGYGAERRGDPALPSWQTAADDGWRAASAATDVPVAETTQAGLPKRKPMAQLVPGGVEKPTNSTQRRTPEAVRGLLSAYHRGVQRGRTHPTDDHMTNPEGTPGGQQSSQPGLGPAAGSGQKEHEG